METPNSNNESLEESSHFVDKNSFVEESLNNIDLNDDVQCNIVEALYKKIPESLDASSKEANNYAFCLVHKQDNVAALIAGYSELSPYTIHNKFMVSELKDINIKTLKPDTNFKFDDEDAKKKGKFITNPNVITKYSFNELNAIKECIKNNKIEFPKEGGIHLITSCTKNWIKCTPITDLKNIEKILTLKLLEKYQDQIEGISKKNPAYSMFNESNNDDVRETKEVPETAQTANSFCEFKNGLLVKYKGKQFLKEDSDYERAYNFIEMFSGCKENVVLSHYMFKQSFPNGKQIGQDWSRFFSMNAFKILYPQMFQPNGDRKYVLGGGFNRQATKDVLKDFFNIINFLDEYLKKDDYENGSKDPRSSFVQKWDLFKQSIESARRDRQKPAAAMIKGVNKQTKLNSALNKETLSSKPGSLRKLNKKKESDDDSDIVIDINEVRNTIQERFHGVNTGLDRSNKALDQQSMELLKYQLLNDLTEKLTEKITKNVLTIVRAKIKSQLADMEGKIKKIKKNTKKHNSSFRQRNPLTEKPNINDHRYDDSSLSFNDENQG